jgi:ATP-binding cassette, subfamily C (CFTR/MRP), member 1
MNAVERVHHYGKFIEVEPPAIVDDKRPPGDWPSKGTIVFKNVEMRYGPTLPLILKKISFSVNDKV